MNLPLEQISNMPAFAPYYAPPPARYRNVKFQFVDFLADVSALRRVLPECLEPAESGYCVAIGLTVPWSDHYGPFEESVLVVGCRHEGQAGFFAPIAFLNSTNSIPAGREIYGTPKVSAEVLVSMDGDDMETDTRLGGMSAFCIRSSMDREASEADFPDLSPSWRLKVIPRADGQGADVCQLIDGAPAMQEVTVHERRLGKGEVEFHSGSPYDLSDFTPREYLGARYLEMDYTEGYGRIVRDFLRPDPGD